MAPKLEPFANCPALDGYHCQSGSLAKMYHYHGHPLSEDVLFGLGSGMGFIYWHMKGKPDKGIEEYIFVGGRGNTKNFFQDIGKRTGVVIEKKSTGSEKKAEKALLEKLEAGEPVMVFGDMGFLPWFEMPEGYHFGGHTFTLCGYDGKGTCLAADMDQRATGLKKGFHHEITLEQLRKARGSKFKPFPPKNAYLEFDFGGYRDPGQDDIYSAMRDTVEVMLNPPIKNIGVKGMRHAAKEILKWPDKLSEHSLRSHLFNLYIFIEIGGTGGGCFRYIYARFLKEAAKITGNKSLNAVAETIDASGQAFSEIGMLFENAVKDKKLEEKIELASARFLDIAEMEKGGFKALEDAIG